MGMCTLGRPQEIGVWGREAHVQTTRSHINMPFTSHPTPRSKTKARAPPAPGLTTHKHEAVVTLLDAVVQRAQV